MALLSEEMDSDLLRLWSLINELSEQLNNNRAIAASLQQQAAQAKVVGSGISMLSYPYLCLYQGQALHSGTGFVLRRFNTDLSKAETSLKPQKSVLPITHMMGKRSLNLS